MVSTVDALAAGERRLRDAFLATPQRFVRRDTPLIGPDEPGAGAVLIRSGFAYSTCIVAGGRRAILDILLPGDVFGIDRVVLPRGGPELRSVGRVSYYTLAAAALRTMADDVSVALRMMAILANARLRADRLAAAIGRLDASARLSVLLLDFYDRLRRRGLIARPSYALPMTQEQIADHLGLTLVHVNRTLRRLREEKIVRIDRQIVAIMDLDRLRRSAEGLPEPPELTGLPPAGAHGAG